MNGELLRFTTAGSLVKPTDGGSSLGVTKVKAREELNNAIKSAFEHGSEVIIEANIEGRELTNGVYRDAEGIKILPITEIISDNEFFDYEAKYKGKSNEVTPADLDNEMTRKIKALTHHIYNTLGMNGIVRMDYIINKEGIPFLIEINSAPGMSKESIVPQVVKIENIKLSNILS